MVLNFLAQKSEESCLLTSINEFDFFFFLRKIKKKMGDMVAKHTLITIILYHK
jgi:hypothetical protein